MEVGSRHRHNRIARGEVPELVSVRGGYIEFAEAAVNSHIRSRTFRVDTKGVKVDSSANAPPDTVWRQDTDLAIAVTHIEPVKVLAHH
eukprot:47868-Eustigmatos_ZCMA.PRE.1